MFVRLESPSSSSRSGITVPLGAWLLLAAAPAGAQPVQPASAKPTVADPQAAPTSEDAAPPATAAPTSPSPSAGLVAAPTRPLPESVQRATPPPEPVGDPPPHWLPPTRPPAPAAPTSPSASPDAVNPMLYAGLGTAALGAAGMVVFGVAQSRLVQLESEPGYEAYRAGQPVDTDVCTAADRLEVVDGAASPSRVRRICDEAGTWETISFVVLPTSIALLGVATYMIVAGSGEGRVDDVATVKVIPSVGPGGGAVVVEGAF